MLNLHPCLTPWTPPTRNWLTIMRHISPEELIALHDANISPTAACRECLIRVGQRPLSGESGQSCLRRDHRPFRSLRHLPVATARGHIFNDANKRTALNMRCYFYAVTGCRYLIHLNWQPYRRGCDRRDICIFCRRHVTRLYGSAE